MITTIKIASRKSPLALAQVQDIIHGLKVLGGPMEYQIIPMETTGDKDKTTPLTKSTDDFFTDAIDKAILEGQAHVAIHSAKDLPQQLRPGLKVFALTKAWDNRDTWVSRCAWKDLPLNPRIGTSSLLRQQEILKLRPDAVIVQVRGTIGERLQLIKNNVVDGVVVAACALKRLGLESEIKDYFSWTPTLMQGQLAVVGKSDAISLEEIFSVLDDRRKPQFLYCGTHPEIYGPVFHWPMIEIRPVVLTEGQQKDLCQAFDAAEMVVLTSPYAVEYLFKILLSHQAAIPLEDKIFAVIGQTTSEVLRRYKTAPQIVAQEETAKGLRDAIVGQMNVSSKRILFPRSTLSNPFLKDALNSLGAQVFEVSIYENIKPLKRDLPSMDFKGVIFTSPSIVRNFLSDYDKIPDYWKIIARGPVTLKTLHEAGYTHAISLS
ncbi:MAG: hydroxymethylbilane synthase [Candidatus Omnitrophica bacterium]|nr:hydroxymethylbilane synthase [Candidatus Omnitrophota bacterium]